MRESLKAIALKGVFWSSVERFSVQVVQMLVMLVIARLLLPKDFGLIGMLAIFIAVAQSLVDSGFSQALIRKQDRTEEDNSTVFYFNIFVSVLIYLILFLIAPLVAEFYNEPQLGPLMRALCLTIVINSFSIVQRAIYTAAVDFKIQSKATLAAAVVSGVISISLALNGYGVWTLVWQQLISSGISTLLLWRYSNWRPKLLYSWQSFRDMFSFGSKLMVSGLIDTIYNNIYQLVIGKLFSASSLGHYSQATTVASIPSSNITNIIQRVTYPVLSIIQDDNDRLRENYRKLLRMAAFVVFPMMCGLAGISRPLVRLLIGVQWDFAATLLIPICFNIMWYPIHAMNLNLLQVKGRSDLFLRLEIIKKIIGFGILAVSIPFGLIFMCYSQIATSIMCLIVNTYYTGKLIQAGLLLQMRDLSGTIVSSFIIFVIIRFSIKLVDSEIWQIMIGIATAFIYYLGVIRVFHFKELSYLLSIIKR